MDIRQIRPGSGDKTSRSLMLPKEPKLNYLRDKLKLRARGQGQTN